MQKRNVLIWMLPVAYGMCIFLFFWRFFPHHLHYQEQFQMFLFSREYFVETCARPGGFCNWAGRFITQFFLSSLTGAVLISCLLTGVQQGVYAVAQRFRRRGAALLLSFIPSLYYWYLLCDENSQTGGVVALLLTLAAVYAGTLAASRRARRAYLFAMIPVLYFAAGGTAVLGAVLLVMYEWHVLRREREAHPAKAFTKEYRAFAGSSVAAICFALCLPPVAKYFLVQYPLYRYIWGVDYVHFVSFSPFAVCWLWLSVVLAVAGVLFLPSIGKWRVPVRFAVQILALGLGIYFVIVRKAYPENISKEEIMAYDYHCRMKNWERIVEMADRRSPAVPMTVSCLNLALYKTGQLPEKMFSYFQNGPEGLLPTFQRDFLIPLVSGEPYWYLGFVNTAQRFAFEAMESFPDFQKSARAVKRLAETNLINGDYEVASKYLHLLEQTLFYRKWARDTRGYLYDSARIDAHPEWGEIRRFRTAEDFLFSEREKDMMLGMFFQQHRDNKMAYEYLMAYVLLTKYIRDFPEYFQLQKDFTYAKIPKSYQEALVYVWGLNSNDMESIPFPVDRAVMQNVAAYANIYTSLQSPEPALRRQFSKTYWYYLHFRDFAIPSTESRLQY